MIPRAPMPPEAAGPGWRLSNWPFAAKMGLAPALALLGVLLLGAVGTLAVRRQSDLLDGVVRLDLRTATVLSQSVAELQAANGGLYRLLTLRAAHAPDVDITTQITGTRSRLMSRMFSAMAMDWPRSSASTPGKAPGVLIRQITGRPNFSAMRILAMALR